MLFILIVVHLLSRDSIAAPLQHPPDARAITDSCEDISNYRTLFSIIWGCLATIFACTWVSVHPNVPPPNQSRLQLFWRRLKMMLIGIIAPEIMVGFAARQFFASRWLSKGGPAINDILNLTRLGCVAFKFSSTQALFFCMGGFVSSTGHPIATKEQLEDLDLGSELQEAIRNVKDKEIMDKSKGDALSKGVALLQALWFTVQCLARVHHHLVVTQLEVATLAFAVVNVFIWLLWWSKPLDVQWPIVVGPLTSPDVQAPIPPQVQPSRSKRILSATFGYSEDEYHPLSSVSVPSFWSLSDDIAQSTAIIILILVGTLFGAIHCTAWNAIFPTPAEMWIWRTSSLVIVAIPGLTFLLPLMGVIIIDRAHESAFRLIMALASPIYIAARLVLLALPLAELRSLPASAFVNVNWSTYIPHI
ncbi:hypothetical protein MSAN_00633700 [Mycena sanguinolenta]|uniref:Uncharacterized protein n=1 Tax=Mycena sanguinolenta TaxID=230812 RepID=A0A8H6Z394_9AGAR|nr:hypothetical protein MSAN_00633700 [Mycena sanguinolenta]